MPASKVSTMTAKELVAAFKTMPYTKRLIPPPLSHDTEDDLTLIDCMSIFLGSGAMSCSDSWQESEMVINLDAALNTVSSPGVDETCDIPRDGDRRHRKSRPPNRRCHQQRGGCRRRNEKPFKTMEVVIRHEAPTGSWQSRRDSCHRRDHRIGHKRRRHLIGFEQVVSDPPQGLVEAVPAPSEQITFVQSSIQQAGATCRIFRCVDFPQPCKAVPARCPPVLASPSNSPSSQQESPRPYQMRHRCKEHLSRGEYGGGSGCEWSRHGAASSNCNAEGNPHSHRAGYRRSLQRACLGEDSTNESVYITTSTASTRRHQRWRHILTSPMPPCYRVRVPAGADAGRPPLKFIKRRSEIARTARNVSRHLRAAFSKSRRRLFQPCSYLSRDTLSYPVPQPPPTLPPQSPPMPPSLPLSLSTPQQPVNLRGHQPNMNNNLRIDIQEQSEDFGGLLRALERAHQMRRHRHQGPFCQRPPSESSIELLFDGGSQTLAAVSLVSVGRGTISTVSSASTSKTIPSLPSNQTSEETSVMTTNYQQRNQLSDPCQQLPLRQQPKQSGDPAVQRKIEDIINAMSDSLLGLSTSFQGCLDRMNCELSELRRGGT